MNTETKGATLNNTEQQFKRRLKLPTLVLIGIAYMSPLVIFSYYGILSEMTKGMYPLTIMITTGVMLLTALSYAQMTKIYPFAGSVYIYTERSIHPNVGLIAGWSILADYLLLPMICYLGAGLYMNQLLPEVPVWVWVVLSAIIVTAVNCRGIQLLAVFNSILTIIPIAFVIVVAIVTIKYIVDGGGTGTLVDFGAIYNAKLFDNSSVLAAAGVLACGFVGFDAVTTMAEETINPKKTLGKAVVLVCFGTGVFFIIIAYLLQLAWPTAYAEIQDVNTGILEYFTYIGKPLFVYGNIIFLVMTSIACCLTAQASSSRILYAMGKSGFLPEKFFGYIHPKFKTPIKNILLTSVLGLSAIFFADNLTGAASLVSFGALVGFAFVNISVIAHFYIKGKRRNVTGFIVYLILPLLGTLACGYLLLNLAMEAKIVGGIWVLAGIIYCAVKTKGFRELPPQLDM